MSAQAPAEALEAIAEEIRAHAGCGFEPCETCTRMVPGEGSPEAEIVVIGEAPGRQEDLQGRPFVGSAGRLLDGLLERAGLTRADVFITNVLKARPPGNRDPKPPEVAHSLPWLEAQIEAIEPRLLVVLGRHALTTFVPGVRITEQHGKLRQVGGHWIYPAYHPAAALRVPALRDQLEEDFDDLPRALARVPV